MTEPDDRRRAERPRLKPVADALYGVFRLIGGHAHGFYTAVLTYLSFSFFVGIAAVWLFAEMAGYILGGATQALDESVLQWVVAHRTTTLDRVALEATALGNVATLAVLVLGVSVFLWLTRHRLSVVLLMVAVVGGSVLNTLLKGLYDRPRPTLVTWGTDVSSQSFPSGHAMGAFIAYSTVAYLVGRLEPSRALRWTTWGFAAVLILAIGASRTYLGVHYPSDILGGYVAGLAWLAFVISGMQAIRYFARGHPEVESEEKDLHVEEEREPRQE